MTRRISNLSFLGLSFGNFSRLAAVLTTSLLCACSSLQFSPSEPTESLDTAEQFQAEQFQAAGSIILSRPVPQLSEAQAPLRALGFVPLIAAHPGNWLSIESTKNTISLMNGETKVLATNGEGLQSLRPGSYQVLHKQTRPVWYAPDTYFSARGLPVPPKNDGQRYRKGALGDFVVIFNKDMPLHNGPIWTQDVGGIKLSDNDLAKIYYSLEVGAPVEVR